MQELDYTTPDPVHPPKQGSIQQRIAAVKREVGAVGKDSKNAQQGFNYRGVDAVINALAPFLNKHEIVLIPEILDYTYETVEVGRNKTPMAHVMGKVAYWFWGPEGDCMKTIVPSESMDSGDKAIPKFMSVAYRIALLQVFNLPTNDPDPDSVVYERSAKISEISKSPETTKTAQNGSEPDFAGLIETAKTAAELNKVWKDAGAAGALDTGKPTIRELLYRRNDELGLKSSSGSPQTDSKTSGLAGKR